MERCDSPSTSSLSISLSDPEKTSISVQLKEQLSVDTRELQLLWRLKLVSWQEADKLLSDCGRFKAMEADLTDSFVSVLGSKKQKLVESRDSYFA